MANAINSFLGNGAASLASNRTTQTPRDTSVATTATPASTDTDTGSDNVQITSTASQLASLGSKLSSMPAVDSARVARISQSIADGTYSVDSNKIAGGLLQSDRALAQIGHGS